MLQYTFSKLQESSNTYLNRRAAETVLGWRYNPISFLRAWTDKKGNFTGYSDVEADHIYFNPTESLIYTELLVMKLRQLHLIDTYESILAELANSTSEENPIVYPRAQTIAAILAVEGAD